MHCGKWFAGVICISNLEISVKFQSAVTPTIAPISLE